MEVFGILWFSVWTAGMVFGILAFSTVMELKKQVEKLEKEITKIKK